MLKTTLIIASALIFSTAALTTTPQINPNASEQQGQVASELDLAPRHPIDLLPPKPGDLKPSQPAAQNSNVNQAPMPKRYPHDPSAEEVRKKMQEKKEADQSASGASQQSGTSSQPPETIKRKAIARTRPSQQMSSQTQ